MNALHRKSCLVLATLAVATPLLFAGDTGQKYTFEQMEHFLQTAKIVKIKELSVGVTNSRRATLDDGTMQHDAHVQSIDEAKAKFEGDRGTEMNFVDSWRYNVAAHRLGRLLEIGDMIPVSVERKVNGQSCAVTWWIDDTMMEIDRKKKNLESPDKDAWNREMYVVRVFDQLIFNTDRNLQNLLIDKQWHIWMIDHTRAFRLHTTLQEKKNLVMCDRHLLAMLRTLDLAKLNTIKPYLTGPEIKGVLARRDKIVEFFDEQVKAKGEGAVLYDRPSR
ncbi:MAG TPA: hypothetical protein VE959_00870 [Bryobacteraceae bacterium]|nr:hypothetical protein [Bryobacteraceae bacterium]